MRILFIIDGLPGGGAEKVVLTLAAHFISQGEQVSLFPYAMSASIRYRRGWIIRSSPTAAANPGANSPSYPGARASLMRQSRKQNSRAVSIWCSPIYIKPTASSPAAAC